MPMFKRLIQVLAAVLIVVACVVWAWRWYTHTRFVESTDNAYIETKISALSARVPGYVEQILVKDNQLVKAGDVLFVIHQADYQAKVDNALAQLASAEAGANTLAEQVELQKSLIIQAQADLESANAELNRVRKDLQRYQQLESVSASSKQQLELVQADELKAAAAVQSASARVNAQRKQLGVLEAQSGETVAAIAQAQAMLDLAKLNLEDTQVRAPVDGVVGNRQIELGRYLPAGAPALNIVSLTDVYVLANFKETQIEHMRAGQAVKVTVDAYPDQPLDALLVSLAPASGSRFSLLPPENATGNFSKIVQRVPVRIEFSNPGQLEGVLRPGLSVVVSIDTHSDIHLQHGKS